MRFTFARQKGAWAEVLYQELFEQCKLMAEFPTILGQLFMNGILLKQNQIIATTHDQLQPIFHKRKFIHGFANKEDKSIVPFHSLHHSTHPQTWNLEQH